MVSGSVMTWLLLSVFICTQAFANAEELQRPHAVIEIDQTLWRPPSDDFVRSVVERLVQEAQLAGYAPQGSVQWSDGYFEATRTESNNIKHRVVVWVDWSLQQPGRVLRVYCRYQKMKKYSGEAWSPVPATEVEEQDATSELQSRFRKMGGL